LVKFRKSNRETRNQYRNLPSSETEKYVHTRKRRASEVEQLHLENWKYNNHAKKKKTQNENEDEND
jgi:hypothetical protein